MNFGQNHVVLGQGAIVRQSPARASSLRDVDFSQRPPLRAPISPRGLLAREPSPRNAGINSAKLLKGNGLFSLFKQKSKADLSKLGQSQIAPEAGHLREGDFTPIMTDRVVSLLGMKAVVQC